MRDITLAVYEQLGKEIKKIKARIEGTRATYKPAPTPIRNSMRHDESTVLTGTAIVVTLNASQQDGWYAYQFTPANGNSFSNAVVLMSGNYIFNIVGVTGPDCALVDWYIDDILAVSGQDWYSAGYVFSTTISANINILTSGIHVFRAVLNGKNALSSNYSMYLTRMWFKQVSD